MRIDLAPTTFRNGFYAGLLLAAIIGIYVAQLWQPERQVQLHTEHFLAALETKDWSATGEFIASDYQDQWGHDRATVLARLREVMRYARNLRITAGGATITTTGDGADYAAFFTVEADPNEVTTLIKERVNTLPERFVLRWGKRSWKPWNWALVSVSNPALELPSGLPL